LLDWLEGRGPPPQTGDLPTFCPLMLAQPLEESDFAGLDPRDFLAEWKWDGIRVQLVARGTERRLYSRSGDNIGATFPEIIEAIPSEVTLDGELIVLRDGAMASFNDLQQRLNRKTPNPKLLRDFPAAVRIYDILREGGEDLRGCSLVERRHRLESWYTREARTGLDLSPLVPFTSWQELRDGARERGIEGLMLKRADSFYVAGRPKGPWFKWKRGALTLDTVLMYAQRPRQTLVILFRLHFRCLERRGAGAGRQGLFGLHRRGIAAPLPLGAQQHRAALRTGTRGEAADHPRDRLRQRALLDPPQIGLAMRFPRIHRIRWDKPVGEADTVETLEKLLS
jgi:DNA ligase 1